MMGSRLSAFLAENKRRPNADEERALLAQEREDQRQAEAERRERELRRAYLAGNPGADDAQWEKEKNTILATDRADRTKQAQDAARAGQAPLYRSF